jgi:hypothetical protein
MVAKSAISRQRNAFILSLPLPGKYGSSKKNWASHCLFGTERVSR